MKDSDTGQLIRRWLREHAGLITRPELLALGATSGLVQHWLATDRLRPLHRGVYVVGDAPISLWQHQAGALLAAGSPAMLSHWSAAWLWDLTDRAPSQPHVVVPAHRCPEGSGYTAHRTRRWPPARSRRGLACTDPMRTLLDLSATIERPRLDALLDRALARQLVVFRDLPGCAGGNAAASAKKWSAHPGVRKLRSALIERGMAGGPAPSVLESHMSRVLKRPGLPRVEAQFCGGPQGQYRLDYAYPIALLAVEVDGYTWHFSPAHLQRDHSRRNALVNCGWMVLVYTWYDVTTHAEAVAVEIERAYRQRMAGRVGPASERSHP